MFVTFKRALVILVSVKRLPLFTETFHNWYLNEQRMNTIGDKAFKWRRGNHWQKSSFSLSHPYYPSLSFTLTLSQTISPLLCLSLSLSNYLTLTVPLSLSITLTVPLSLSLNRFLSLSLSLSITHLVQIWKGSQTDNETSTNSLTHLHRRIHVRPNAGKRWCSLSMTGTHTSSNNIHSQNYICINEHIGIEKGGFDKERERKLWVN